MSARMTCIRDSKGVASRQRQDDLFGLVALSCVNPSFNSNVSFSLLFWPLAPTGVGAGWAASTFLPLCPAEDDLCLCMKCRCVSKKVFAAELRESLAP